MKERISDLRSIFWFSNPFVSGSPLICHAVLYLLPAFVIVALPQLHLVSCIRGGDSICRWSRQPVRGRRQYLAPQLSSLRPSAGAAVFYIAMPLFMFNLLFLHVAHSLSGDLAPAYSPSGRSIHRYVADSWSWRDMVWCLGNYFYSVFCPIWRSKHGQLGP